MANINTILAKIVAYQIRTSTGAKSKIYTTGIKDGSIKVINVQSFTI